MADTIINEGDQCLNTHVTLQGHIIYKKQLRSNKKHISNKSNNKQLEKLGYKSHNKTIFWSVVLVLVLINQAIPGPIIGLTLCKTYTTELNNTKHKL